MWLKNDIRSHMHDEIIYGRQGQEVKVISDHDNVLIVENEDGNRFSVLRIHCTHEYVNPQSCTDTAVTNININRAPVSRRKAAPINQTSIF